MKGHGQIHQLHDDVFDHAFCASQLILLFCVCIFRHVPVHMCTCACVCVCVCVCAIASSPASPIFFNAREKKIGEAGDEAMCAMCVEHPTQSTPM